jgi:hypothetical protein
MTSYEVGQLIIGPKGRFGRVIQDCGEFVVLTSGDPTTHAHACEVIAVYKSLVAVPEHE